MTATAEFVHTRLGGLPRAFWFLWTGTLVNRLGTMVLPFLSLYLTNGRNLPVTTAGVVLAVVGVGQMFSQLIGGILADRVGRRATLTGGMLVTGATMLALGYAESLTAIVVCSAVLGLAIDSFRPASQAIVADLVPAAERTRAFGLLLWAVNLGFSVAMVLGGTMAKAGFSTLFWANAATCVLFGLLVWRAIPETGSRVVAKDAEPGSFADVLRDRAMLAVFVITLIAGFAFLQCLATLPLAMNADGLSTASYGIVMAINGIAIVVMQPFIGHRLGGLDRSRTLAVGITVLGIGYGAMTFASTTWSYAVCVVVWTLGEIIIHSVGVALVADLAPAHLRGRYNGVYGTAWGVAAFAAPLGGTQLLVHGAPVLWLTCFGLCLAAACGQLLLGPTIRRRTTEGAAG
ncbi:MDR family MFS transporter [Lentzea sp. JNUCC 0626]|uniref:MDR family MFS transporter n=1 Tax=Lentzea sp. JNUCC 0626 TaxID=3367513 RepID=UPI0037487ED6